jgi:hypothetical protein
MTELDRALAAGLARELRAVYDLVEVHDPSPGRGRDGPIDPSDCRRVVVWHEGAAGRCALAMIAIHPDGLVLRLGPRLHHDWARLERISYADPEALSRILAGLSTVEV